MKMLCAVGKFLTACEHQVVLNSNGKIVLQSKRKTYIIDTIADLHAVSKYRL